MRVWHTNAEDPTSTRRSTVPILPKPPSQDVPVETEGEESWVDIPDVDSIPQRPRRKQANDSVSCNATNSYFFWWFRTDLL